MKRLSFSHHPSDQAFPVDGPCLEPSLGVSLCSQLLGCSMGAQTPSVSKTYALGFGFCLIGDWGQVGRKGRSQNWPKLTGHTILVSPLRKDLRRGRPQGPSASDSCPNSSTPSGSDFPGFSFGFWGYREDCGAEQRPSPRTDLCLGKTLAQLPPRTLPPLSAPFSSCPGSRGARSRVPAGGVPRPRPAGTLGTAAI